MERHIVIDVEMLITLVENKPALWDKTNEGYKDRSQTRKAWTQVCIGLDEDYEELSDEEKKIFVKEVIKRWGNMRDAFVKSLKRQREASRIGSGRSNVKKYIFYDQLQFLNNSIGVRNMADPLEGTDSIPSDHEQTSEEDYHESVVEVKQEVRKQVGSRKRKLGEEELQRIQTLRDRPVDTLDRHISFFKGIIPSLDYFDDDQIVQFQLGVLQLVSDIKHQKRRHQP